MYAIRFGRTPRPEEHRPASGYRRGASAEDVPAPRAEAPRDLDRARLRLGGMGLRRHPDRCLSAATACLYGITEAAVLAAGYAPAIGFIHSGKPLSFVYDIADLVKFETVVPVAFRIAATEPKEPERAVRLLVGTLFGNRSSSNG